MAVDFSLLNTNAPAQIGGAFSGSYNQARQARLQDLLGQQQLSHGDLAAQLQGLQVQSQIRQQNIINQAMADEAAASGGGNSGTLGGLTQPSMASGGQGQPSVQGGSVQTQSSGDWSPQKIRLFAESGNPGLMKAAELEQARQISRQTDLGRLLDAAGVTDPTVRAQVMQAGIAKANNLPPTRLGEGAYFDPRTQSVQGLPAQAPAGSINVNNGGVWSTQPVTGGLEAAGNAAGTIESARENNKIGMVTINGRQVPARMGDVVASASGVPSNFEMKGANGPLDRSQILGQASSIVDPTERAKFVSSLSTATPQQINPDQAWATMPKMQQPTGIGMTPYQEGTQKEAAKAAAELSAKYGTQAEQANQRLALNNQALDLVNKSDIGPGATIQADVKNIIQKFVPGISEDDFQNTPSATLSLQKDLVNAATQKAKQQYGSRITQSEVMLMLNRGAPNVAMPKAALQYLLQSDNAQSQYQVQQADDLGKYINNGGDPYRFEAWYSQAFPMNIPVSQVKMGGASNQQSSLVDQIPTDQPVPYTGKVMKINGDMEYNVLPKGAHYAGPDGIERVK